MHRSAIVPFSDRQMFDLVADIEAYPDFLPACEAAEILETGDGVVVATLTFGIGGIRGTFTTRNGLEPPGAMTLSLEQGLFRSLEGHWRFAALGDEGCNVSLDIEFDFDSPATDLLAGRAFEALCNQLVDAFATRAQEVYGN